MIALKVHSVYVYNNIYIVPISVSVTKELTSFTLLEGLSEVLFNFI